MLGFDIKDLGAPGFLPNSATSATINLTTGGETYYPGVVTTTIDLYSPDFTLQRQDGDRPRRQHDPAGAG